MQVQLCGVRSRLSSFFSLVFSLLLLAAISSGCDSNTADQFQLDGAILNTTDRAVRGATVTLDRGGSESQTTTTRDDGTYTFESVEEGEVTLTVTAPGYTLSSRVIEVTSDGQIPPLTLQGEAQVRGEVVDAVTGQPIEGADIYFSFGTNTDPEEADLATQSEAGGAYQLVNVPVGTFLCVIRADGFADTIVEDVVFGAGDNRLNPAPLTETLDPGQFRFVLSWGESPFDLDSHLTGPALDGNRFHVYFANREPTGAAANLDRDDTSSFGPETVTITGLRDGMYRYSVYNYSDPSSSGAEGMAASPARVEVFDETGQIRSYTAPPAEGGEGNTWRVLELTVAGDEVTINDAGGGTFGYVDASNSGDITTFVQNPGSVRAKHGVDEK
jgi:hypothetical protein